MIGSVMPVVPDSQLNIEDRASKAKIKTLIGSWIASGALVRVEKECPNQRKLKSFVEVGTWATD